MADAEIFEEEAGLDVDDLAEGFGEEVELLEEGDEGAAEDIDVVEVGEEGISEEGSGLDDNEADLADVLATTIWKVSVAKEEVGDDIIGPEVLPDPRQKDEFRCSSCRLLKKNAQLADLARVLCKDCV